MSRISRKATKAKKPWWKSTPFLACVAAVAISLFLQWEPVAEYVDIYLGTATSSLGQRSLQSKGYTNSLGISMQEAADERCELPLSNCRDAPASIHESFEITLINHSPYRVDVHWDDGRFGRVIANCEGNGAQIPLSVFRDNTFFITRHGVKEGLFDPATDLQHRFTTNKVGQTFVIPASAIPSNNPCQDRFAKACADYARNGQCWGAPGWMIVHCCKSCDKELNASKLIDSSVRCTKENMNISTTGGVWEPGDLNRLFTSWATDEQFEQYSPNILSSPDGMNGAAVGPWVMTFDTFFGAEEADALIKGGELVGYDRSTNQGAMNALGEMEMVTSTTRTSSNAWCRGPCEELPGVQAMTSRIEQVTGIPRKNYEPFQILEYQDNQFYKSHHDSEGRDPKPSGNRILTFFLYLSDVEEGGETKFNSLGIQVKPKRGRALVWPSVRDDEPDFWDDRTFHEAMPVIKGKKYAANHWIHFNDYEGPNLWGCTGSFD